MAVSYTEYPEKKLVALTVDGKVLTSEFDEIAPQLEAFIEAHGQINLLEIVQNFGGFEFGALVEGIKFDIKYLSKFDRVAVVTDIGWISPISKAAGAVLSSELKTFTMTELEDAKVWIGLEDEGGAEE